MVVASPLVKNLLIPWQDGARWFWDTLVDADLANNTLNWQWVAGSGADAAPYFRIFNPLTQAERYDRSGEYVLKWVSQSSEPIVDLAQSRDAALDAYAEMRRRAKQ
jgi:deoxyribodipyrimidine photo-lyase